jgi:predicted enzyme related to lactoylglutathione lyase
MSDTDGKITWFEIAGDDGNRARGFYGGLFGWQFQPFEEGHDYQMTDGGAVFTNPESKGILVYFGTSDIDASVAKVRELGGEAGEPQEIPNVGRYAHCSDTEGNAFGLYQAG